MSAKLRRAGRALPTERVTRAPNARATYTAVASGDADAGIVYATDVPAVDADDRSRPPGGEAIAIGDDHNVVVRYPAVVLSTAVDPATARAFVDALLAAEAQATLRAEGFGSP